MTQSRTTKLKERLIALIDRDFSDMDPVAVSDVLARLARDVRRSSFSEASAPSVVPREPPPAAADSSPSWAPNVGVAGRYVEERRGEEVMPRVQIQAEDRGRVASLLHQILEVGALFVQIDQELALNEHVDISITYVPLGFSVMIHGRIVHRSKKGSAIEVIELPRQERVALEEMYREYHEYLSQVADSTPSAEVSIPEADESSSRAPISRARDTSRAPTAPVTDSRSRLRRPRTGTGVGAVPRLGTTLNEPRFVVRRQVDLITPDDELVSTSERNVDEISSSADELFGPTVGWVGAEGDPDRIDQLATDRILDILLQLSEHSFSGVLNYNAAGGESYELQLFFDSGFLVEVKRRPRKSRYELAKMLLLAKRVDEVQVAMAAAHADEHSLTMAKSLLELDLLTPEQLRHAIAGRLTFLLREVVALRKGEVQVFESQKLAADFLPMPQLRVHVAVERIIFNLLFERLRTMGAKERELASRAEMDAYPELVATERERLERAISQPGFLEFLERTINGRRRLREVFTESTLSSADTFAVLFSIHRMGLLRFDRSLHHTVVRERFRENVTVKYLSVHKASYFEVLNVHWSSYDDVIQKAYEELIEQFDPAKVPSNMEPEVHQRVTEIRDRVNSAYQVLAERETRHSYRMRIMPEYKLVHAIPLFLKQCELAEKRQQWEDARDSLRRVLEIQPDHDEARAHLVKVDAKLAAGLEETSSEDL